ncbi:MAG: hypothetical protein K6E13_07220 [Lachnospiraceae bacterium]|nr:hypothetical protein [Lachnospiraceae bacterium]
MKRKAISVLLMASLTVGLISGCGTASTAESSSETETETTEEASETASEDSDESQASSTSEVADAELKAEIEEALNLANNEDQEWSYDSSADAWVLSITPYVYNQELPDQQGVSVCVPGAYVTGIDTDGDGASDVTAADYTEAVKGSLVIDYEAEVTSTNGQVYTAATAPIILNTGAAGYGSQQNSLASTEYAAEGYINVSCGNRGKQDTYTDEDGNEVYTGDAPSCLSDQKSCARFIKYNILLGNLPGNTDYLVSTGGSGGGAHAAMFAATSNSEDFYDYQIEEGAVGVYATADGGYTTTVTIDGVDYEISDGAWGCIAYSAITSLAEADMAMALEYYVDADYDFNTAFQAQMAEYLSASYMEYINDQNLTVEESAVGFDLNGDGDTDDTIELTIEYDEEKYADTNGYGGTYLDLYLAEFTSNLQWYLDNLDYAEGWTWFDEDGNALSDEEVANMTTEDKAKAFIEGRYASSSSSEGMGGPGGAMGEGGPGGDMSEMGEGGPGGDMSEMGEGGPDTDSAEMSEGAPDTDSAEVTEVAAADEETESTDTESENKDMVVGTPDEGTSQSAGSTVDSANYSTYEEMLESYQSDIAEIEAGDEYGNNIVELYNPLNYIGSDDVDAPTWTRIVMGAAEGDMSMFSSLNMQIAWLNAGTDCEIEWQWNGGHVPSETLGNSFSLYVDQMYGEYVDGAVTIEKQAAEKQTENGDATEATGTDISSWVNYDDISNVSVTLADAASYRTDGASKATPGFDVMDYGQEDYVFGDSDSDARHWDKYVLEVLEEYADVLSELFNNNN